MSFQVEARGKNPSGVEKTLQVDADGKLLVAASVTTTAESTAEATAAAPAYAEGQDAPLSQDLKGNQRVSSAERQYTGVPSSFAILTADGTVFTLAAGERGFVKNLHGSVALAYKLGASCSTTSLSDILACGSATDDGRGASVEIKDYVGAVSVATMSGTGRYLAWKQAL